MEIPKTEVLQEISKYIEDGASEEEACILVGIEHEEFKKVKDRYRSVAQKIRHSEIKFKYKQLRKVGKDPKAASAMWLLESRYPKEYGKKTKKDSNAEDAATFAARFLKEIQKNSQDASEIVKYEQLPAGSNSFKEPNNN